MSSDEQRRADTRAKIQLGGLVIKAGLQAEAEAVLLGALMTIAQELATDPAKRQVYRSRGDAAFRKAG